MSSNCANGSKEAQEAIRAMFPQQTLRGMKFPAAKPRKQSTLVPITKAEIQSVVAQGKVIVISGPSGVGKGTLIERLKAEMPDLFGFGVSHTTREPRAGDQNGVHYHFSTREQMEKEIEQEFFLEHVNVHGNFYGTSKAAVEKVVNSGKLCVLDIDVQGARSVRNSGIKGTFVFLMPPSIESLEERLRGRGSEDEEALKKRLANAQEEMDASAEAGLFDHVIVNENVAEAYKKLKAALKADIGSAMSLLQSTPGVTVNKGKPLVVFVLGGPGAGKGTQCANIVSEFGWVHLSAGDLLRAEQASGSEDADMINSFIKEGRIVPVEVTIKLLEVAMAKSTGNKFLIDGFPRSMDNYEGWMSVVGGKANVAFCLFFECTEETLKARLLKRGETSGRADDNEESIMKRFVAFQEKTMPVVNMFEEKGILKKVSSAQTVDEVWAETKPIFIPLCVSQK